MRYHFPSGANCSAFFSQISQKARDPKIGAASLVMPTMGTEVDPIRWTGNGVS
jgi:hypothetical protein